MPNVVEIVLGARDDSKSAVQSYTNGIKEIESRIKELKDIQADAARSMLSQGTANQTYRDAQADLRKAGEDLKSTQKELKEVTDALGTSQKAAASSGQGLFTTFTAANLAATAITRGIDLLKTQFTESINAANQYQASMAGLSSYAVAFGNSASAARESARQLSNDGLLPVTNSANALKNIMSTGLGLDEATELVSTFKDRAAFGRNASIDFGTAVENLAQSFKTEQSELGDASGMTENYSQILQVGAQLMGKNVNELSNLERAQAKYQGILALSTATQGDANRYAETAAGQQAKLAYAVNQTQVAMGTALQPAVSLVQQTFVDLINTFAGTDEQMKNTQGNLVTLAAMFNQLVIAAVSGARLVVAGIQGVMQGSVDPIVQAVDAAGSQSAALWDNWGKQIANIANGTADAQVDANKQALMQMLSAQDEFSQKQRDQIDRENRDYTEAIAKRATDFKRSMQDMIIDHRDKSRSIQADINAENAAYAQQVARRKADYDEAINDLDEAHADKVADIEDQIAKERAKGYNLDGVAYTQANQEKIDELQKSLDKENTSYQKARDKKVAAYNQDVADAQASHDQKLTGLQTELQKELDVLKLHAADVAAVGEATKLDDLSRLKQQYAEENAEAAKQHAQRLADIKNQGSESGGVYSGAYLQKISDLRGLINQTQNQANGDLTKSASAAGASAGSSMWENFKTSLVNGFVNFHLVLYETLRKQFTSDTGKKFADLFSVVPIIGPALATFSKALGNLPKLAGGGAVRAGQPYWVGDNPDGSLNPTSELFVPGQSGTILNQRQLTGSGGPAGGGNTVHIYNPTYNTISDAKGLVRDIGFRLSLT